MADRHQILCVNKSDRDNPHERITHIGGKNGDGSRWNLQIEYMLEDQPLGTAGPLRQIAGLDENFLVMNGDLLTDIDYSALFSVHCERGSWGTIAVHRREVQIDYGVIEISPDGALDAYIEKPSIPYWVSMGINVLSRRALEFIPENAKFDMPELMLALRQAGKPVICFQTDCYWQDIGRFDDYQQASTDFDLNRSRFMR